jgi:hypothetical protein
MPMATVMAAAKMMAPITSNRISLKDIAHRRMRPQPSVTAGAWSKARVAMVTLAKVMITNEWYAAKAEARLYKSSAA